MKKSFFILLTKQILGETPQRFKKNSLLKLHILQTIEKRVANKPGILEKP